MKSASTLSRRTFIAAVGASLASMTLLGACSSAPYSTGATTTRQATTVDAWDDLSPGAGSETLTRLNAAFEAENPQVRVNRIIVPVESEMQAGKLLLTAAAAGSVPDASRFDRLLVAPSAGRGLLADLTAYAARDSVQAEDYFPFAWEEVYAEGKLWALPWTTDLHGFWYNTAIAAEQQGITSDSNSDVSPPQVWVYSTGWIIPNDLGGNSTQHMPVAALLEKMQWFRRIAGQTGEARLQAANLRCRETGCDASGDYFHNGRLGLFFAGSGYIAGGAQTKSPAVLDAATLNGWSGASGWVMTKETGQADAAWSYLRFLSSAENQVSFSQAAHSFPTAKAAAQYPFYKNDALRSVVTELLALSHARPAVQVAKLGGWRNAGNLPWSEVLPGGIA